MKTWPFLLALTVAAVGAPVLANAAEPLAVAHATDTKFLASSILRVAENTEAASRELRPIKNDNVILSNIVSAVVANVSQSLAEGFTVDQVFSALEQASRTPGISILVAKAPVVAENQLRGILEDAPRSIKTASRAGVDLPSPPAPTVIGAGYR